jgi:hypothetical protein
VRRHRFLNRGSLDQVIWDWTPSPTVFVRRVQALGTGACRLCDGATVRRCDGDQPAVAQGQRRYVQVCMYRYVLAVSAVVTAGGASCVRHDSKRAGE